MGNTLPRQVAKTRSFYHDPSIRQALQQRRFATVQTAKKPQAPNPQLRVALQARYGELALQKKPQDSGKVRQLVASKCRVPRPPSTPGRAASSSGSPRRALRLHQPSRRRRAAVRVDVVAYGGAATRITTGGGRPPTPWRRGAVTRRP